MTWYHKRTMERSSVIREIRMFSAYLHQQFGSSSSFGRCVSFHLVLKDYKPHTSTQTLQLRLSGQGQMHLQDSLYQGGFALSFKVPCEQYSLGWNCSVTSVTFKWKLTSRALLLHQFIIPYKGFSNFLAKSNGILGMFRQGRSWILGR